MTSKTTPAPAPAKGDGDQDAELQALRAEIKRLKESSVAALAAQDTATAPPAEQPPTHRLLLADGTEVESVGTVATHHYGADGQLYPVTGSYPIHRGEV